MATSINDRHLINALKASQDRMNEGLRRRRKREMLAQTLGHYFRKISGNSAGEAPEQL